MAQPSPTLMVLVVGEPSIVQNITGDVGLRAPLHIVGEFQTATAGQNSTEVGALNTLRLFLGLRDEVSGQEGMRVTVTGLKETLTADTMALRVWNRDCNGAYGDSAEWNQANGALVLRVIGAIPAGEVCSIDVQLRNPLQGQEAPLLLVSASGITILEQIVAHDEGSRAPLLIGDFLLAEMYQMNPFIGGHNTINVTFVTRIDLPASSSPLITFSGMVDMFEENVSSIPICVIEYECVHMESSTGGCCDLSLQNKTINCTGPVLGSDGCFNASEAGSLAVPFLNPIAQISSSMGTLIVSVMSDLTGRMTQSFSFSFQNPTQSRRSVQSVEVTSSGVYLPVFLVNLASGNGAPFLAAGWEVKQIAQSTTVAGRDNTITISLSSQAILQAGIAIDIRGLHGGVTPSGMVDVMGPVEFGPSALWELETGSLIFTLSEDAMSNTTHVVQVILRNPSFGRDSPSLINVSASLNERLIIAPTRMDPGEDNLAPFLVGDFVVKSIKQTWPTPRAENRITVSLAARIALTGGFATKITLQGLTGSITPGRNDLIDFQPANTPF
eukprot:2211408-Rhodomonas_salina.1